MVRRNPNRKKRPGADAKTDAKRPVNNGQTGHRPPQRQRVAPQDGAGAPPAAAHDAQALQAQLMNMIRDVANNSGVLAAAAPPDAADAPQAGPVRDDDAMENILQAALNANQSSEAKREMLLLIKNEVRNGLWRRIKIINSPQVKKKAALDVLVGIDFASMRGDSVEAQQAKDRWLAVYEGAVCKAINEQRSYVQSRIKSSVYSYWKKHNKTMPPKPLLLTLIARGFGIIPGEVPDLAPEDHEKMVWWVTQVLSVAAGNQSDWGADHYLYMTVQEGHFPESATKLYVPESTEAIAVWLIENNYDCWPEQWAAKEEHGEEYPILRKAKDASGVDLTVETSYVSIPFMSRLPLFCHVVCPSAMPVWELFLLLG